MKGKKLEKGEIIARHSGPVTVLKWRKKKCNYGVNIPQCRDTEGS